MGDNNSNVEKVTKYDILVNLIINNSKLAYADNNKLRIDDGDAILEFIKASEPEAYRNRLTKVLDEEKNKKEDF